MKMYKQIILRAFLGLTVAGFLNGCTMFRDNMATSTTDYNLVVEKAQNEMLLLNIVRASKRRPMYFTSLSAFRGKMSYGFQTGDIHIPFGRIGKGKDDMYSIAPSVSYSNNPEFDLAVQNSREFTCGIMTPVPIKTIDYYWQQGWPKEMLLYLFIYRIEIKDANGTTTKTLKNYPVDRDGFEDFRMAIEKIDWDTVDINVPATPGKERDANEAPQLQTVTEILKFALKKEDNKGSQPVGPVYLFTAKDEKNRPELRYKVYIRSPEAILYYLGEIARVGNKTKDPDISKINFRDKHGLHPTRLFYAHEATADDTAPCVSVDYEGVRYVIPQAPDSNDGYCTDRSMHVLSLVSQLIGLQKEATETPVTGVVSVIGR